MLPNTMAAAPGSAYWRASSRAPWACGDSRRFGRASKTQFAEAMSALLGSGEDGAGRPIDTGRPTRVLLIQAVSGARLPHATHLPAVAAPGTRTAGLPRRSNHRRPAASRGGSGVKRQLFAAMTPRSSSFTPAHRSADPSRHGRHVVVDVWRASECTGLWPADTAPRRSEPADKLPIAGPPVAQRAGCVPRQIKLPPPWTAL